MARLFADFAYGNLTVPVGQSDTTLSSPRFTRLPQVTAPDFLAVTLDPAEDEGALPEIVWVTDHAAGSSSCTVARGQENTSARAHAANCVWRASVASADFAFGGDLTGTPRVATVAKINGVAVSGTPSNGDVIAATGSSAAAWTAPAAVTSVTMGGDVTGPSGTAVVAKVKGITISATPPTTGQVLTATGASAADWETPTTGAVLAGDVTGAAGTNSVDKLHGVDISSAGVASIGKALIATDASHATWQTPAYNTAVTMAGDVTGPSGTSVVAAVHGIDVTGAGTPTTGQVLTATDGTHATWQAAAGGAPTGSAGGDLTGTYPNPTLATSGVTAGTYGDGTHVSAVSVNAKGIVTGVSSVAITGSPGSGLPQSAGPHVVAPNSASAAVKAFANYVGTGVSTTGGDEVAINNAITAAASANGVGVVYLLPGTYYINPSTVVNGVKTAIVMQSGVRLEGVEPAGAVADSTTPVAGLTSFTGAYVKLGTTPNANIDSLISHAGYNSSAKDHDITIRNIIFDGDVDNHKSGTQRQLYDCGSFWDIDRLTIERCWFMDARGNAGGSSTWTTTASGSGSSSTSLTLAAPGAFSTGDEIQIGGVSNLRKISSLAGSVATLDQAATWANGATVTGINQEAWNLRNQRCRNVTVRDCMITRKSTTDGSTGINSLYCDGVFYENVWAVSNKWHGINHHQSVHVRNVGCHMYLNLHWGLNEGSRDITWENCYMGGKSNHQSTGAFMWWPVNTDLGNTATTVDSGNNDGSENLRFIGCHWINNKAPIALNDNGGYGTNESTFFTGCTFRDNGNASDKFQVTFTGSSPTSMVHNTKFAGGCMFHNTLGATFNDINLPAIGGIKFPNSPNGATGGVVPAPNKPASGATIVNPFPFACQVSVTGGTGTNLTVVQNGVTTALGAGNATALVEPGDSIGLGAYTGSPTWTWFAFI